MERPWISTNLAVSIDGKIAPAGGCPGGWTSEADHLRLLDLRREADALLVGRATLEADRMTLTVPGAARQPLRCVASRGGSVPRDHPLFHTKGGPIHLMAAARNGASAPPGTTVHPTDLAGFLAILRRDLGVSRLHCEGGGGLIRSLAELDAIDEFHLTLAAHHLFGGRNAVTPTGEPGGFLPRSHDFELTRMEIPPGRDECFLSYRRKPSAKAQCPASS